VLGVHQRYLPEGGGGQRLNGCLVTKPDNYQTNGCLVITFDRDNIFGHLNKKIEKKLRRSICERLYVHDSIFGQLNKKTV